MSDSPLGEEAIGGGTCKGGTLLPSAQRWVEPDRDRRPALSAIAPNRVTSAGSHKDENPARQAQLAFDSHLDQRACDQCSTPFSPRQHGCGSPQQFCNTVD